MTDDHRDETAPQETGRVLRFTALRQGALFAERYEIRERLGAGGFGEVYRVRERVADLDCALKVLFPRTDAELALERLRREVRAVRALSHPGIVRVHDVGEHDGLLYFVQELLRGESLRQRLEREGALPVDEALRIGRGLLEALAVAHAAGIVHRDVTPSNVFLDETGRVVVLDFGLARRVGDATLTATGQLVGTAEYVSPEQARGAASPGPATDIYSAGIVIWEMLAGTVPFAGDSIVAVLTAQMRSPLPRWPRALRRAPRRVRTALTWMLEKDPESRPRDGAAAAGALVRRDAPGLLRHRVRWIGRTITSRRWAVAIALSGALAVAVIPVDVTWQDHRIEQRNVFGVVVRTVQSTDRVQELLRTHGGLRSWTRWYGLVKPPTGRGDWITDAPLGLIEFDALRGSIDPLYAMGPNIETIANPLYQHFAPRWGGSLLLDSSRLHDGESCPSMIAFYGHYIHYPSLIVGFRDGGGPWPIGQHPGRLKPIGFVELDDGRPKVLSLIGQNSLLGKRRALVGLGEGQLCLGRAFEFPPTLPEVSNAIEPEYYTPLPLSDENSDVSTADGMLRVRLVTGEEYRLDLATGVPLDASRRGGLDVSEWVDRRRDVMQTMQRASWVGKSGATEEAARMLEQLAERVRPESTFAGVALGQAARMWLEADRLDRASAAAQAARTLEPDIVGHARTLTLAVARRGAADAFRRLLTEFSGLARYRELERDLAFAGLVVGEQDFATGLGPRPTPAPDLDYYRRFLDAVRLLHSARSELVSRELAENRSRRPILEFQYFDALARTIDPSTPNDDLRRDAEWLRAQSYFAGQVLPLRSTAAVAALRSGGVPPERSEIEAELAEQRRAAKVNVVDLYFLAWGEALAARVASLEGDRAWRDEQIERLRRLGGRGPWLRLVLDGVDGVDVGGLIPDPEPDIAS